MSIFPPGGGRIIAESRWRRQEIYADHVKPARRR